MKIVHTRWKMNSLFLATLMTSLILMSSVPTINVKARVESTSPYLFIDASPSSTVDDPLTGGKFVPAVIGDEFSVSVILHGPATAIAWNIEASFFPPEFPGGSRRIEIKNGSVSCDPVILKSPGNTDVLYDNLLLPNPELAEILCDEESPQGPDTDKFWCVGVLAAPVILGNSDELWLCSLTVIVRAGPTALGTVVDRNDSHFDPVTRVLGLDTDGDGVADEVDSSDKRPIRINVVGPVGAAFSKGNNPKAQFKHMDVSRDGNVQTITAFVDKMEQKRACMMIRYTGVSTAGQTFTIDTDVHKLNDFTTQAKLEVSFQHDPIPAGWKVKAFLFSSEITTDIAGNDLCLPPSASILQDTDTLNYRVVP